MPLIDLLLFSVVTTGSASTMSDGGFVVGLTTMFVNLEGNFDRKLTITLVLVTNVF